MGSLWLSLHLLGFTAWVGGLLSVLASRAAVRREDPAFLGVVARAHAGIYRTLVGPGAMATVVSGLVLTLQLYGQATSVGLSHALMTMQGLGLIAGLIALIVSVPTASRIARLEPVGPSGPLFAQLSQRLRTADLVMLALAVVALVAATIGPPTTPNP